MKRGRVYFITFAGIIGVGKSTLLHQLESSALLQTELERHLGPLAAPQVVFIKEPIDLWTRNGWLDAFYQDKSLNAAAFQFLAFSTHTENVEAALATARVQYGEERDLLLVSERSMYDQRLFWELQRDNQETTANSLYNDAYVRIWQQWRRFEPEPDLIFYLYVSQLDTAMERINARARGSESLLSRDYQAALLVKHDAWFTAPYAHPLGEPSDKGVPCERICADAPYHENSESMQVVAQKVIQSVLQRVLVK
jgi:deoxyadenosine/deoxycytidine kinase